MKARGLLAALLCLSSCSLLYDLDATVAGRPAAPASEAGAPTDSGEGGATNDADSGGDVAPRWCATQPPSLVLCDDFDDGELGARWTTKLFQIPGVDGFSREARSGPRAFELDVPTQPARPPPGFAVEALTERAGPGGIGGAIFAFDVKPRRFPLNTGSDGYFYAATITQGPGGTRQSMALLVAASSTKVQEQIILADGTNRFRDPPPTTRSLPLDVWTRVELDIDLAATPHHLTVRLDKVDVLGVDLSAEWTTAAPLFYLGNWFVTEGTTFHVLYDDATLAVR